MAIAGSQGEGEGVEGVKRRQPREGRRVVGSQAQEGFKHLIAGRAEGLPPPPHRRLTASAKAVIASACGVTTLGDPARVPHCKESWPLSGHERTRIGKTKLRPAVKQGEHAPFH